MKSLYESFKDYVAVDILNGEYKYTTENFGLQDAKKGIIFESFPRVLYVQLKRFEYDIHQDAMVKINDRHEYPFEIDLDEFLSAGADRSQPWIYKLHGVFVHSGDLRGGRYWALIKPDREARWLKFDDERVTGHPRDRQGSFRRKLWRGNTECHSAQFARQSSSRHETLYKRIHVGVYPRVRY